MLCGCISSSMASPMSQSMYLVFAEKSSVSCSLIICSWLMLCSNTADLSVCASCMCLSYSLILIWIDQLLCPIQTWPHHMGCCIHPNSLVPIILLVYMTCEARTECSATSAHKIQTLGNQPKERIQHSQHGESLKSRIIVMFNLFLYYSTVMNNC